MQKLVSATFITITVLVGTVLALNFLGALVEGVADYAMEHERCLKHATNGYEIKRCH